MSNRAPAKEFNIQPRTTTVDDDLPLPPPPIAVRSVDTVDDDLPLPPPPQKEESRSVVQRLRDLLPDTIVPHLTPTVPSSATPHPNRSLWESVKSKFTDEADPEARAMFQSMGYLRGLTGSALGEAANRIGSKGEKGIGYDEWAKAARGHATPLPQQLQKAGMGKIASYAVGVPAETILDPMGSFLGGAMRGRLPEGLPPTAENGMMGPALPESATVLQRVRQLAEPEMQMEQPGAWSALLQNVRQPFEPAISVAGGLRKAGKTIFKQPWKPVDAKLATQWKGGDLGESAYSDYLWNDNDRLINSRMSNQDMVKAIRELRPAEWKNMLTQMERAPNPVDLAPTVTGGRTAAGSDAANAVMERAAIEAELSRIMKQARPGFQGQYRATQTKGMGNGPANPEEMAQADLNAGAATTAAMKELRKKLRDAAEDPNNLYFRNLREKARSAPRSDEATAAELSAQDSYIASQKQRFIKGFAGEHNEREATAQELAKLVPDFAPMIEENMKRFKTGGGKDARDFFNGLVEDVFEGPRSLEVLNGLGAKYGREAARADQTGANIYKASTSPVKTKRLNQAGTRRTIADLIDDKIGEGVEALEPGQGAAAQQAFREAKKGYSTLARGEKYATDILERADKTPAMSKADAWLLYAHPGSVLPGKLQQWITRHPRFATAVGGALGDAGKSNVWDNMIRNTWMDQAKEPK